MTFTQMIGRINYAETEIADCVLIKLKTCFLLSISSIKVTSPTLIFVRKN